MTTKNRLSGLGEEELAGVVGELQDQIASLSDQLGQMKISEAVTEDWLQIPFRFVSLLPGATSIVTRTIAGDGPFDLVEVTHTALSGDAAPFTPNDDFRIRIREGESVGRSLTLDNEFVDANNSSGTAQRPYIIKGRRRYRANIAIIVEVTNTSLDPNTIEVVLHGIKVFTR